MPLLLLPLFAIYATAGHVAGARAPGACTTRSPACPTASCSLERARARPLDDRGRDGPASALFLLDLDRFKEVNDTLGHHTGDHLLQMVAQRLRGALRPDDVVARLGGDEFAVLLPDVARRRGGARGGRAGIRAALAEPFRLEGMLARARGQRSASRCTRDHGDDVEQLLQRADVAMYVAKDERRASRSTPPTRDRTLPDAARPARRRCASAIDDGELELHYQPKVVLRDRRRASASRRWCAGGTRSAA